MKLKYTKRHGKPIKIIINTESIQNTHIFIKVRIILKLNKNQQYWNATSLFNVKYILLQKCRALYLRV